MKPKSLSPLLTAFVAAHNQPDSAVLARCFARDATVTDERHSHRGTAAIKAWFDEVTRKYQAKLAVSAVTSSGGTIELKGSISGNFDGSPIDLRYLFTEQDGKFTSLEIVP